MTSLMTRSVLLFLGLMLIAKGGYADISEDLSAVYNGHLSNINQVNNGGTHDLIELRLEPVLVPQLGSEPMMYLEEAINGTIFRMGVANVTADKSGTTVFVELITFIDFSVQIFKPNTYNTEDLKNVPLKNFKSYGPCPQTFFPKAPGDYTGAWVDCGNTIDEQHPSYAITVDCDGITFIPSATSPESSASVPYILLVQDRFPLINPSADFVNPCSDSSE